MEKRHFLLDKYLKSYRIR